MLNGFANNQAVLKEMGLMAEEKGEEMIKKKLILSLTHHFDNVPKDVQTTTELCPLTLFHTISTFNDLKKEDLGKQCVKSRKCW